jgi:hypothetical protein
MVPRSISNLFQLTDDVHNYETRQVQNYFPPDLYTYDLS